MKLHSNTYNVEKSSDFEENNFTIEASAKAFMILSDGLYSNKILAVVRELSTNAYDSHVDAGCVDKPFEVHLPTRLEPFFHVRDFGTSMTHDQCMTLYTTYFRSTRNNSNDAVGCLGLGSKAPFAYADSFTVEAFLNGEKRIYSAHRNSNGSPSFALLETVSTDEPNGIKVSMPVKLDDISSFYKEATHVFQYFKVRPNTNCSLTYKDEKPVLSSNDGTWEFCRDSKNYVIMGQIAYDLDISNLINDYSSPVYKFLYETSGLHIFVNIGDVDITPSRESLSYNNQTKANLIRIISNVMKDVKDSVENSIKNEKTLFKARKKYVEIENQCGSVKSVMQNLDAAVTWNGQALFDSKVTCGIKIDRDMMKDISYVHKSNYRKKVSVNKDVESIPMRIYNLELYIDDVKRGGISRIRHDIKDGSDSRNIYVYKLREGEDVNNCAFFNALGGATIEDVKLTSNLPKVTYNRVSYSTSVAGEVEYYDQYGKNLLTQNFSVKSEDAVYLPTKKEEVTINGKKISQGLVIKMLKLMYEHAHYDKTFYFVSPSVIENRKLNKRDNWEGPEYFMELFNKMAEFYFDDMNEQVHSHEISHSNLHNIIMMTKTDNEMKKILTDWKEYDENSSKSYDLLNTIWSMCRNLGIKTPEKRDDFDSREKYYKPLNSELEKYPLLSRGIIRSVWNDTDNQMVADYIDLVENSKSLTTVY